MSPNQESILKSITRFTGRHVIVAGPGCGKTMLASATIDAMCQAGEPPDRIIAMTFTRAAGRELQSRLKQKIGYCGTLHSYAGSLLGGEEFTTAPDSVVEMVLSEASVTHGITRAKLDQAIATAKPKSHGEYETVMTRAARSYWNRIRALGMKSHDMILREATLAVQSHPKGVDQTIFVDEAQDLSPHDWEFIHALHARRLVVFGDVNQSIYGFRGADPRCLISELSMDDTHVHELSINYRSRRGIQTVADRLKVCAGRLDSTSTKGVADFEPTISTEATTDWLDRTGSKAILCRTNDQVDAVGQIMAVLGRKAGFGNDRVRRAVREAGAIAKAMLSTNTEHRRLFDIPGSTVATPRQAWDVARANTKGGPAESTIAGFEAVADSESWIEECLGFDIQPDPQFHLGTIHSAKGCEWDHVWIPACDWPSGKCSDEARRLMYVALTRAKQSVQLTGAAEGNGYWLIDELCLLPKVFTESQI